MDTAEKIPVVHLMTQEFSIGTEKLHCTFHKIGKSEGTKTENI